MQPTDLPRFVCDVVCAGFFANFAAQCVDAVMIREPPWLTLLLLRRERVAQTARHWRLPEMDREGEFHDRGRATAQIAHKPTRINDLHELKINVSYPFLFYLDIRGIPLSKEK